MRALPEILDQLRVATFDSQALIHNCRYIQRLSKGRLVMLCLKSNAYGHGIEQVAQYTQPFCDAWLVASLSEAISLRKRFHNHKIVLTTFLGDTQSVSLISHYKLDWVVFCRAQIDLLVNQKIPLPINVWLKLDSGFNRMGFLQDEMPALFSRLQQSCQVKSVNLMSHYACAGNPNHVENLKQATIFNKLYQSLDIDHGCMANSAALQHDLPDQGNWVKPGILLYGICPAEHGLPIEPVMKVKAKVIAQKHCPQGGFVGYGATWQASQDTQIAVISFGYADGYVTAYQQAKVLINGLWYPVVGKVSMDSLCVDLGNMSGNLIGSWAWVWGQVHNRVEMVVKGTDHNIYEMPCHLSNRVQRQWF